MTGFEWDSIYELSVWDQWGFCTIQSDDVRSGNYALRMYGSYASFSINPPIPAGVTCNEIYVQFAAKISHLDADIFHWYTCAGDTRLGHLNIAETGQLRLYMSSYNDTKVESSVLLAQGSARLQISKWYVFELHIKIMEYYGSLELRVDGNPDCTFTGTTCNILDRPDDFPLVGSLDRLYWAYTDAWMDDIIVNDSTGSFNNTWPGCLKVILLRPKDDGDSTQWTTSTEGHNYDMVNEVPYDPTNYISTTGIGDLDLYEFEELPSEAVDVMVVRGDAWCYKESGSASQNRKLVFSMKPGMTVVTDSDAHDLSLSYLLVRHPFDYNPDTSTTFTKEEVNNLQAGIKSST